VERFSLDNGLRVVLAPDRSVPVVAVSVFYDVGMRNEPEGRTGFAHLFEHMMFQGSAHVPKMEHARLVQAAGGTFNGSTHQDYTNYFEALPAEALERALFLEADRMAAPAITEENLRNQIDVVKEEIRVNVLNRPYGAFPWLQLPRIAFDSFANTHDGYGSFVDLESSTVDDATDFFSTYYAPGNAVLCIGGDLDVGDTEKLVRRWFGPVPRLVSRSPPGSGTRQPTAPAGAGASRSSTVPRRASVGEGSPVGGSGGTGRAGTGPNQRRTSSSVSATSRSPPMQSTALPGA
jgi:predicted Zn-dependent peptidase